MRVPKKPKLYVVSLLLPHKVKGVSADAFPHVEKLQLEKLKNAAAYDIGFYDALPSVLCRNVTSLHLLREAWDHDSSELEYCPAAKSRLKRMIRLIGLERVLRKFSGPIRSFCVDLQSDVRNRPHIGPLLQRVMAQIGSEVEFWS